MQPTHPIEFYGLINYILNQSIALVVHIVRYIPLYAMLLLPMATLGGQFECIAIWLIMKFNRFIDDANHALIVMFCYNLGQ
jgi:hypothetical protein